jgi:hypothetical protein
MNTAKAERVALYVAVAVIVALTGAAFALSYSHLASVAGAHGLGGSDWARWSWPGTLDMFILAGEVLMFRAALRQRTDPWAIGLTVVGSVGSVALNIAGVGSGASTLDYIVAGVPPTAALLAFGALMKQVHTMVTRVDTEAVSKVDVATPDTEPVDTVDTVDTVTVADTAWDEALADMTAEPDTADVPAPALVPAPARVSAPRGRSLADIQRAVDYLQDTDQEVNGSTYAAHVGGISTRTGRRDLSRIGINA